MLFWIISLEGLNYIIEKKEFLHFVIGLNPFFQITTRFHYLSEYAKRSATLLHCRLILPRSTPVGKIMLRNLPFNGTAEYTL